MTTAARLLDTLTPQEQAIAERVDSVLPTLAAAADEADRTATFPMSHIKVFSDAGLLGLVVPESFGGLGGGLRDLAAATFALGTACPSTALAFFFHCSSASRGLLGLEALEAGLFPDEAEAAQVRIVAEKILTRMGREGRWMGNFASEEAKSSAANVFIQTEATPVDGGWRIKGVKSFGCATGVADDYLVTAKVAGVENADGLGVFIVPRGTEGVGQRAPWDGIGMRASANHGITLDDVFVPAEDAIGIPGAFVRMMQMSRGSFVGNQLAASAVYVGAAQALFDHALQKLTTAKFVDTGKALATSPMHQQMFGEMQRDLESARQWLNRQIALETSEPPLRPKQDVLRQWRIAKGSIAEASMAVATNAFKACGTSSASMYGPVGRGLRDISMGLVMAFPPERGRLEAAQLLVEARENQQLG